MCHQDIKYELYCKQEGHENQEIIFVCIYQDCDKKRTCCQSCIKNHNHCSIKFTSRYMMEYEIFKNLFIERYRLCSCYFNRIKKEELEQMLHDEIIKILIPNQQIKQEKLYYYNDYEYLGWKLILSNNQRLIAKQDNKKIVIMDIQNGLKVYRRKNLSYPVYNASFSPNDTYLYICSSTQLIQLQISNNIQNSVDYSFQENSELISVSETQVLLSIQNHLKLFDFQTKQEILNIDTYQQISCLDFQAKSNNFTVFTWSGIYIWDIQGKLLCTKPDFHYKLGNETKVKFFGNQDLIISTDPMILIIWKVEYNHQNLILEKIILCSNGNRIQSFDLCVNKNQIYLLIDGHLGVYQLGEDKLKSFELSQNEDFESDNFTLKEFQILQTINKTYLIRNSLLANCNSVKSFRNNQMNISLWITRNLFNY